MCPTRTQQHGYLTARERADFRAYAREHELHATALGRLLMVRELRLRRLPDLLRAHSDQPTPRRKKVTVHLANPALKLAFAELASNAGASPSAAAAAVFRAELTEKWLSRAIRLDST
jgi:hypothetical protein